VSVFELDVTYSTHERLKRGQTEPGIARVQVEADSFMEAEDIALAMVYCHNEATGTYPRV
jgi:hypothetical protein